MKFRRFHLFYFTRLPPSHFNINNFKSKLFAFLDRISLRLAVFPVSLYSLKIKMPKKAQKGAEAWARAGNPEMLEFLARDNVDMETLLLKAFNENPLSLLESLDGNDNVSTMMSTLLSSDIDAGKKIQKSIQDTMRKIATGEFNDPDKWDYGDGDQSPVKLPGSQNLRTLWGKMNHMHRLQSVDLN